VTCAEVAASVLYLADDAAFTTGTELSLDGGITGVRLVETPAAGS
jgi:hypothetical protein